MVRLAKKKGEASGTKDMLVQDSKAKREYLESLQPKLNNILQVGTTQHSTKPAHHPSYNKVLIHLFSDTCINIMIIEQH